MHYWMAQQLAADERAVEGWWLTLCCVSDGATIDTVAMRSGQGYEMTRLHLNALVDAGYLQRDYDHADGRVVRFSFTRWNEWRSPIETIGEAI